MSPSGEILLDVRDLTVEFEADGRTLRAVDGVSFAVRRGEVVGLVGESGAGKSLTSEAILRLVRCPPGRIRGEVRLRGQDLLTLDERELARVERGHVGPLIGRGWAFAREHAEGQLGGHLAVRLEAHDVSPDDPGPDGIVGEAVDGDAGRLGDLPGCRGRADVPTQ